MGETPQDVQFGAIRRTIQDELLAYVARFREYHSDDKVRHVLITDMGHLLAGFPQIAKDKQLIEEWNQAEKLPMPERNNKRFGLWCRAVIPGILARVGTQEDEEEIVLR